MQKMSKMVFSNVGQEFKYFVKMEGDVKKYVDEIGLPDKNPLEVLEDPRSERTHMQMQSKNHLDFPVKDSKS